MARQQRNSVDYFPHPVNHGKGMFYMRQKYKNNGYAVWMILLEKLGDSEYHYLDMQSEIQIMYLSAECMVDKNMLIDIINDLVLLGEFDKELWEKEKILFNEKFVSSIKDAYKKRNNNCVDRKSLLILLDVKGRSIEAKGWSIEAKSTLKVPVNPQSKEEYSKEEENKEDERSKPKPKFNFKKSLIDSGVKEDNATEWTNHRKKAKASNTDKAFTLFINQVKQSNLSANDAVEMCLGYKFRSGKVWIGFNAEWARNAIGNNGQFNKPKETPPKIISKEANYYDKKQSF